MAFGKVYGTVNNPRFAKVMITAAYSGVEVDTDKDFKLGVSNKEPAYLEKFPLGQAPALETSDGKKLTESSSIAHYIAEQKTDNPLLGKDAWERSRIIRFVMLSEAQLFSEMFKILYMVFGIADKNQEVADKAYVKLNAIWSQLDSHLKGREFLAANRLTLADIDVVSALVLCYQHLLHPELRSKYPELERYFKSIAFLPHFQEHLNLVRSEEDFCKKSHNFS